MQASLSRVIALNDKAMSLSGKGHHSRAAKIAGRAIAAAQALGFEDCLIVATLQIEKCRSLSLHHVATAELSPAGSAAFRESRMQSFNFGCAVLPDVMVTLQRRLAAGTLLPGTCRPCEVSLFKGDSAQTISVASALFQRNGCTRLRRI